jgi:hypothetical protein
VREDRRRAAGTARLSRGVELTSHEG